MFAEHEADLAVRFVGTWPRTDGHGPAFFLDLFRVLSPGIDGDRRWAELTPAEAVGSPLASLTADKRSIEEMMMLFVRCFCLAVCFIFKIRLILKDVSTPVILTPQSTSRGLSGVAGETEAGGGQQLVASSPH